MISPCIRNSRNFSPSLCGTLTQCHSVTSKRRPIQHMSSPLFLCCRTNANVIVLIACILIPLFMFLIPFCHVSWFQAHRRSVSMYYGVGVDKYKTFWLAVARSDVRLRRSLSSRHCCCCFRAWRHWPSSCVWWASIWEPSTVWPTFRCCPSTGTPSRHSCR